MLKKLSLEEKSVLVYLLTLVIFGVIIYFYPTQFFTIYDKILFFILK